MAHQFQFHEKIHDAVVAEAIQWAMRERKPMRRAAKVDDNQGEIVQALRQIGCSVQPLHTVGKGVPDLLVGFRGKNLLLEIKDGNKVASARRLTTDQKVWHRQWCGQCKVVSSVDEAIKTVSEVA